MLLVQSTYDLVRSMRQYCVVVVARMTTRHAPRPSPEPGRRSWILANSRAEPRSLSRYTSTICIVVAVA